MNRLVPTQGAEEMSFSAFASFLPRENSVSYFWKAQLQAPLLNQRAVFSRHQSCQCLGFGLPETKKTFSCLWLHSWRRFVVTTQLNCDKCTWGKPWWSTVHVSVLMQWMGGLLRHSASNRSKIMWIPVFIDYPLQGKKPRDCDKIARVHRAFPSLWNSVNFHRWNNIDTLMINDHIWIWNTLITFKISSVLYPTFRNTVIIYPLSFFIFKTWETANMLPECFHKTTLKHRISICNSNFRGLEY